MGVLHHRVHSSVLCRGTCHVHRDSSPVHFTGFSVDTAMKHDICVQVPPRMTASLPPNDIKVYGPLSSAVRSMWVNQVREEPEVTTVLH